MLASCCNVRLDPVRVRLDPVRGPRAHFRETAFDLLEALSTLQYIFPRSSYTYRHHPRPHRRHRRHPVVARIVTGITWINRCRRLAKDYENLNGTTIGQSPFR